MSVQAVPGGRSGQAFLDYQIFDRLLKFMIDIDSKNVSGLYFIVFGYMNAHASDLSD